MNLIIGLGNPGIEYKYTKHNAGFLAVDYLCDIHNASDYSKKFKALVTNILIEEHKIILAKPQTFMNLSGESALTIKNFYKLNNKQIIVIHDDIDLPLGEIRIKTGGGTGGHNGLKSLDYLIGQDYKRIRIGVARPINKVEISDYVLSRFSEEELKIMNQTFSTINTNIISQMNQA